MAQRRPSVPRTRRPQGSVKPDEHVISAEKQITDTGEHQIIRANFGARQEAPKSPVSKNTKSEERAQARAQLSAAIRKGSERVSRSEPAPQPAVEPVPARRFSGRLLALAVVLITIIVMLAPSVRVYIQQRSEIAALEQEIAVQEERQQEIETQVARWSDPSFVKAQARERLFLVMPGEKRYLVKGIDGFKESEKEVTGEAEKDLAWVDALWDSVQRSATAQ